SSVPGPAAQASLAWTKRRRLPKVSKMLASISSSSISQPRSSWIWVSTLSTAMESSSGMLPSNGVESWRLRGIARLPKADSRMARSASAHWLLSMLIPERSRVSGHHTNEEMADQCDKWRGLRVLVFTSVFPSAAAPNAGLFIRERMFRVARHVPLVVVAPVAWSPVDWIVRRFRPGFRPMPVRHEVMDGVEVYRPRFLSVPGVLKRLDGWSMALCCWPTVRRLRRSFGPTVIDGHFLYPDGFAATWLGQRLGIPTTVNIRGSKDQLLIGTSRERGLRRALQRAAGILAVSEQLVRDVACPMGVPEEKVAVVGNGIDLERFAPKDRAAARARLGLDPDARVLVGVGNLVELKGFQRVIPLLPRLRERYPNLQYLTIGGSAQPSDLRPNQQPLDA